MRRGRARRRRVVAGGRRRRRAREQADVRARARRRRRARPAGERVHGVAERAAPADRARARELPPGEHGAPARRRAALPHRAGARRVLRVLLGLARVGGGRVRHAPRPVHGDDVRPVRTADGRRARRVRGARAARSAAVGDRGRIVRAVLALPIVVKNQARDTRAARGCRAGLREDHRAFRRAALGERGLEPRRDVHDAGPTRRRDRWLHPGERRGWDGRRVRARGRARPQRPDRSRAPRARKALPPTAGPGGFTCASQKHPRRSSCRSARSTTTRR